MRTVRISTDEGDWAWEVGGSCEKILPKWRYEGKTILKGQLLGATLREQREEDNGYYGEQGKLIWRVTSREVLLEKQTKEEPEVTRKRIK